MPTGSRSSSCEASRPSYTTASVVEVHFQTERLGWKTDDFLVVGENGAGTRRKLVGQVKRTFTVSATDDECKKAIQDFWKDFKNGQQFSPAHRSLRPRDASGGRTRCSNISAGLLDCSRAARDGADFERRLATPGFISAKAVQYCDEIRTIIGESEGRSISEAEVWPFLRVLHVLSLDLNTATRQTEAMIKTLLAHTTGEQDALGVAQASWDAFSAWSAKGCRKRAAFGRNDLPDVLLQRHSPVGGDRTAGLPCAE